MDLMSLAVKIAIDTREFTRGMTSVNQIMEKGRNAAEKFENTLGTLKTAIAGVVSIAAIKKVASDIKGLADATSEAGDRIDKNSQALGMSRRAYQQWDYILGQSGASIDSLGVSMKTLNTAITADDDGTIAAFNQLGLSMQQLQGLSPEDAFEKVVRAFQEMPEGATKSALAVKLFGRNGQTLLPLLNSATDSIDNMRDAADRMGFIMSDSMVDASVKYGDTMDNLKRTLDGIKNIVGYSLLDSLTGIAESMTGFFSNDEVQDAIKVFAVNIHSVGNVVLTGVQGFFEWMTLHATDIADVMNNISAFVGDALLWVAQNGELIVGLGLLKVTLGAITSPIALITAGVILIASKWNTIKEFFNVTVPDWMKETFGIDFEFNLPTWAKLKDDFLNWWGAEDNGIRKNIEDLTKIILAVDPPEGSGLVEIIGTWWKEIVERVKGAIVWTLTLPTMPSYESGQQLAESVKSWFRGIIERGLLILDWAFSLPAMPDATSVAQWLVDVQNWWLNEIAEKLKAITNFVLGFAGLPDADTIIAEAQRWWNDQVSSINEIFKIIFGYEPITWEKIKADFDQLQTDFENWWKSINVLKFFDKFSLISWEDISSGFNSIREGFLDWWASIPIVSWASKILGFGGGSNTDQFGGGVSDGTGSEVRSFASGIDYVPSNGFKAILHEGEAVLKKTDAEKWRIGGQPQISAQQIASAVSEALTGMAVTIDGSVAGRVMAQTVSREIARNARTGRFAYGVS